MRSLYSNPRSGITSGNTRRHFLAMSASAAFSFLALGGRVSARHPTIPMKERSLQDLRLETFSEQLSSHFQVIPVEGTSLPLLLVEVERRAPRASSALPTPDADYEQFCLIFAGPAASVLPERIYRFEHPQIGWFDMFIVPILTPTPDLQHYQAVFNRPLQPMPQHSQAHT